jgi:hypothetical protein
VRIIIGAHRPDVVEKPRVRVRADAPRPFERRGQHVARKVRGRRQRAVGEQAQQRGLAERVHAHRRHERARGRRDGVEAVSRGVGGQARERRRGRLLLEPLDVELGVDAQHAPLARVRRVGRGRRDRHVGARGAVRVEEAAVVHLVELVPREHEHVLGRRVPVAVEVRQVAPHGVLFWFFWGVGHWFVQAQVV